MEEKLEIKRLGRPLPDLDIEKRQCASSGSKSKERIRKFNRNLYLKNNWLCGCEEKNAFFCFPCVLFGGEDTWVKIGVKDVVHIWMKIKSHENSKTHINNVFSFFLLGKSNSTQNSAYRQTVVEHNAEVDKNRYVLNILINCIRFCGALGLSLRGHDERDDSENMGIFRELIHFTSHLDKDINDHISNFAVFKETSKITQNELLKCMLEVYHEEVAKEIKKSDYVAVIADETTDASNEFQLVIILRYIVDNKPVERFWNFVNPAGHNAFSILNCILTEIGPLICDTPNKLIAQSYDGSSVMSGNLSEVQKKIKKIYPLANYVHYYAHQMNLILSNAASSNRSVRIFFAYLSGICSFFSASPQRTRLLDEIVRIQLPRSSSRSSQTKWDFHSRAVNTIYEYRRELMHVMASIENNNDIKLYSVVEQAGAYKLRLKDKEFVFWLTIFYRIMPHVETIFEQLQKTNSDPVAIKQDLQNFQNEIQQIRDQMDTIMADLDFQLLEDEASIKKRSRLSLIDTYTNKKREALVVCDSIMQQIKARFSFTGHLVATNLFKVGNFAEYQNQFPSTVLREAVSTYPFLEKTRLKTELQVIYERDELRNMSGAVPLLSSIVENEMHDTFQETLTLLKILITTPMFTSEAERCFSVLKGIKAFLRNPIKEGKNSLELSALGILSFEKSFLDNIENFNQRVLDLYAKKDRGMDFGYKYIV